MEVLGEIPIALTVEDILAYMRAGKRSSQLSDIVQETLELVEPLAWPKALYDIAYVERANEDTVTLNGVRFLSRVMRINFDAIERVFPFVATCGTEVDSIPSPREDPLRAYCLDVTKELLMRSARQYLKERIDTRYAPGHLTHMAPGSLKDWPLTEQRPLFDLLGDVKSLIGVTLADSCLMIPAKSTSGIFFPTEVEYENCQLCARTQCPRRRAQYDERLHREYGLG